MDPEFSKAKDRKLRLMERMHERVLRRILSGQPVEEAPLPEKRPAQSRKQKRPASGEHLRLVWSQDK
jgi:hypothetical protein